MHNPVTSYCTVVEELVAHSRCPGEGSEIAPDSDVVDGRGRTIEPYWTTYLSSLGHIQLSPPQTKRSSGHRASRDTRHENNLLTFTRSHTPRYLYKCFCLSHWKRSPFAGSRGTMVASHHSQTYGRIKMLHQRSQESYKAHTPPFRFFHGCVHKLRVKRRWFIFQVSSHLRVEVLCACSIFYTAPSCRVGIDVSLQYNPFN